LAERPGNAANESLVPSQGKVAAGIAQMLQIGRAKVCFVSGIEK